MFDSDGFEGTLNVNQGVSMRVLNRPSMGLIVNWAYGQDGSQFTRGGQPAILMEGSVPNRVHRPRRKFNIESNFTFTGRIQTGNFREKTQENG